MTGLKMNGCKIVNRAGGPAGAMRGRALWAGLAVSLGLSACTVGPDYHRPAQKVGGAYANAQAGPGEGAPEGQWQAAQPKMVARQDWWLALGDSGLTGLMARMPEGNLDLAQSEAQYRQARAALSASRAGLFPSVGVSSSLSRGAQGSSGSGPSSTYDLSANVNWEVDLWGRVRREVESSRAGLQASEADLAAMRLSLQSTLAQSYFAVRVSQLQDALLARTLQEYQRALDMTRNRLAAGIASPADVAAASAQLDQTRVQRIRLGWQRAQQVHAVSVLLGQVPSDFHMPSGQGLPKVPQVPAGVPSALLEHRPDISAAERRAAQANAQIGVARAAWFPDLTLSAQGGYSAGAFASWITAPARFWTLGPALAFTLFDGGARSAAVAQAQAAYDAQAAAYRKTVLDALREVEDALVQSHDMVGEQAAQDRALAAARETLRQTTNQYEAGLVDYLSVVQAQASALSAEQNSLSLQAQRLDAAVQLVVALGGGWPGLEAPDAVVASGRPAAAAGQEMSGAQ